MAFVGKFRGSSGTEEDLQKASTYYAMAGRYLWNLIREAEAEEAAAVKAVGCIDLAGLFERERHEAMSKPMPACEVRAFGQLLIEVAEDMSNKI
jgi:hypothetical protein